MSDVTMTYDSYSLTPVPFMNIERTANRVGNLCQPLGFTFRLTLSGTLTPLPGDVGIKELKILMDELREAFDCDCKLFEVLCDATVILRAYPRIISINFEESDNNWVETVPYTIVLEYDTDDVAEDCGGDIPATIEDFTEEWNVEFNTELRSYSWDLSTVSDQQAGNSYTEDSNQSFEALVSHTVTAKGKRTCGTTGDCTNAAESALTWLLDNFSGFGYDAENYGHAISGWTNLLAASGYDTYDHFRTHNVNETDGTVTLTESWIVHGTGENPRGAREDFSVEIRETVDDGRVSVGVNGTIFGLQENSYASIDSETFVDTTAYDNASNAWTTIKTKVFPRAQFIYEQDNTGPLNPDPVSKTIGYNPSAGTIQYGFEYDNRPCTFIDGALSENFTITDNNPADVFASLVVLGRVQGPVLQAISTVTQPTREVTIEAVMPRPTSCTSISDLNLNKPNITGLLCDFETELTDAYDQVFKNNDSESWSPLSGRYSRTVGWTYMSCSGSGNTSFC